MPTPLQATVLRRLFAAPVFDSEDQTQRARMLHGVIWTIMISTTVVMAGIALTQPDLTRRAMMVMLTIGLLGFGLLELVRRQQPRLASILLVASLITVVTVLATTAGGIRSPGVTLYFAFVLSAGILLGERAAIRAALICAALGTGLVIAELTGVISPTVRYGPIALLLLNMLYMSLVIALTRLATQSVTQALERAESELAERRQTERRLDLALDAARIGTFEHAFDSGFFTADNRAFEIFGLEQPADRRLPWDRWLEIVHPEDRDEAVQRLDEVRDGASSTVARYRITAGENEVRHVVSVAATALSTTGTPAKVVGMIMDVTEREQLVADLGERVKELTLLQSAARLLREPSFFDRSVLRDIIRQMPAAWQHSHHCEARLVYLGESFETAGWQETPWRQSQAFETSAGPGVLEVVYTRQFPAEDEGPFQTEERLLLNSLVELLVGFLESEYIEQQRRDVEQQLRQSQKMQALGTLAGGIAHDFNNILTAIGGNVELALAEAETENVKLSLREVKDAHDRARDLVRRILVFSRRQEPVRQVIALESVVEEALKLIRSSVGPHIRIVTQIEPDLPPVFADATQIHQVVMNLATNAAYAMTEQGGQLTVKLDSVTTDNPVADLLPPQLKPGHYVRLCVEDDGSGMSEEILARLFDPFFTTKGTEGTGLGLSVVHGIVTHHEGAVHVRSTPGEGTCFEIYFPASAGVPEPAEAQDRAFLRGRGQSVICVDDEETVMVVMTRMIERLGYRVRGFTNPFDALQEFHTRPHQYDAVITDMGMPGMSGADLALRVHEQRPEVPVIISSGAPPTGEPANGVTEWMPKPAGLREIGDTLDKVLNHQLPPLEG